MTLRIQTPAANLRTTRLYFWRILRHKNHWTASDCYGNKCLFYKHKKTNPTLDRVGFCMNNIFVIYLSRCTQVKNVQIALGSNFIKVKNIESELCNCHNMRSLMSVIVRLYQTHIDKIYSRSKNIPRLWLVRY